LLIGAKDMGASPETIVGICAAIALGLLVFVYWKYEQARAGQSILRFYGIPLSAGTVIVVAVYFVYRVFNMIVWRQMSIPEVLKVLSDWNYSKIVIFSGIVISLYASPAIFNKEVRKKMGSGES
jgi:hypothetical protein